MSQPSSPETQFSNETDKKSLFKMLFGSSMVRLHRSSIWLMLAAAGVTGYHVNTNPEPLNEEQILAKADEIELKRIAEIYIDRFCVDAEGDREMIRELVTSGFTALQAMGRQQGSYLFINPNAGNAKLVRLENDIGCPQELPAKSADGYPRGDFFREVNQAFGEEPIKI